VSPTEFLVKSSGSQSEVQTCLQGMLPNSKFTLSPLSESNATKVQTRLKQPQLDVLKRFQTEAASGLSTYQVQFATPPPLRTPAKEAGSAATTKGAKTPAEQKGRVSELSERELEGVAGGLDYASVLFDPQFSLVSKPLIGGTGPVGVTVGVGISGKF
jgi:hypothetical protein